MSVLHSIFTPHPRYRLSGGLKARGFDRPPCPGEKERERERDAERPRLGDAAALMSEVLGLSVRQF